MNKKQIVIGIVIILLIVGLSGCDEISNPLISDKDKLVGTWEKELGYTNNIVFFSDGDCSISGFSGTWEIKDEKLVIDAEGRLGLVKGVFEYYFSNNDNTLHLKDVSISGSDEYEIWYRK